MTTSLDTAPASTVDVTAQPRRWLAARLAEQHAAWFGAADPRALAVCRILVYWHVWPGFRVEDYTAYAGLKSSAWYPVSFFRSGLVPLLDASGLELVGWVACIASALALLGLAYPVSALATALATLYLRGVPQNFGKVNHSENLLIFALFIFAFARAADAWSLDAWLARRRGRSAPAPSGHYRWPVRFITLLVVTMYAAAGCSKLMNSGWDWAFSDSFQRLLLRHHFTHRPPTKLGVWLADHAALCQALALGALLIELGAPLALFGRWLHRVFISALFTLQVSIYVLLGVRFSSMLPLFMCLLPWNGLLAWFDRATAWGRARLSSTSAAASSRST